MVDNYTYITNENHITPPAGLTREQNYARIGLSTHKGNCYNFAASLAALLRHAGYNPIYIEGAVTYARGGLGPHGWVELEVNGGRYMLDAQLENQCNHSGRPSRRGRFYMVPVGQAELNYVR